MAERNLLTRKLNPSDRRSFTIELTPDGRKLAARIQKMLEAFEEQVKDRITERHSAGFRAVMAAIADVTDVNLREKAKS